LSAACKSLCYWDLSLRPTFSVPLGTPVTYVGIWLKLVPSFSRPSSSGYVNKSSQTERGRSSTAHTHLAEEFLDSLVDIVVGVIELLDDHICLDFERGLPLDGRHGGQFGERGCGSEWRRGLAGS
jgi:hypothetical protein